MKKHYLLFLSLFLAFVSCEDPIDPVDPTPDPTTPLFRMGAGVTDIEGNSYKTVIIKVGSSSKAVIEQEWMMENLRTKKYADGTDIPNTLYEYCNEDEATLDSLGLLYTWDAFTNGSAAVGTQGACPEGWHVPTVEEYRTLFTGLGGDTIAGMKMKSINTNYWNNVTFNSNASGFNAHGGGWVSMGMTFHYLNATMFWTSTENGESARIIQINSQGKNAIHQYDCTKTVLNSCRCIKN
jgi:uncharacterized protein (TIGR02145 family)